ncbi:hypothetical protein EDD28_0154 [Salana multivorans]|uniref:Uncharacterized protein n=1 Tax=Salana multivorans TaxID=120377 RepID=A0A3N2D744_9MICO|nr:hypothetical protein EDD28_0154 [Salana multivorans]
MASFVTNTLLSSQTTHPTQTNPTNQSQPDPPGATSPPYTLLASRSNRLAVIRVSERGVILRSALAARSGSKSRAPSWLSQSVRRNFSTLLISLGASQIGSISVSVDRWGSRPAREPVSSIPRPASRQRCCPVLRGVRRTLRRPPPGRKSAGSRACHARLPGQTETNGSDRPHGRRPAGLTIPGIPPVSTVPAPLGRPIPGLVPADPSVMRRAPEPLSRGSGARATSGRSASHLLGPTTSTTMPSSAPTAGIGTGLSALAPRRVSRAAAPAAPPARRRPPPSRVRRSRPPRPAPPLSPRPPTSRIDRRGRRRRGHGRRRELRPDG